MRPHSWTLKGFTFGLSGRWTFGAVSSSDTKAGFALPLPLARLSSSPGYIMANVPVSQMANLLHLTNVFTNHPPLPPLSLALTSGMRPLNQRWYWQMLSQVKPSRVRRSKNECHPLTSRIGHFYPTFHSHSSSVLSCYVWKYLWAGKEKKGSFTLRAKCDTWALTRVVPDIKYLTTCNTNWQVIQDVWSGMELIGDRNLFEKWHNYPNQNLIKQPP